MNVQPVILYVEDDHHSREVMEIILREVMRITRVTIFDDSRDFVSRLKALDPQPDVILLDIHVTPHNGFEMLKLIRNESAFDHVPVVALTASVMNEEVHELQIAGFIGVVAKPVDMDTFPEILNHIMTGEKVWNVMGKMAG